MALKAAAGKEQRCQFVCIAWALGLFVWHRVTEMDKEKKFFHAAAELRRLTGACKYTAFFVAVFAACQWF